MAPASTGSDRIGSDRDLNVAEVNQFLPFVSLISLAGFERLELRAGGCEDLFAFKFNARSTSRRKPPQTPKAAKINQAAHFQAQQAVSPGSSASQAAIFGLLRARYQLERPMKMDIARGHVHQVDSTKLKIYFQRQNIMDST